MFNVFVYCPNDVRKKDSENLIIKNLKKIDDGSTLLGTICHNIKFQRQRLFNGRWSNAKCVYVCVNEQFLCRKSFVSPPLELIVHHTLNSHLFHTAIQIVEGVTNHMQLACLIVIVFRALVVVGRVGFPQELGFLILLLII